MTFLFKPKLFDSQFGMKIDHNMNGFMDFCHKGESYENQVTAFIFTISDFHNLISRRVSKYYRFCDEILPLQPQMHSPPLYNNELTDQFNPPGAETGIFRGKWVTVMAADGVATQGAMTSAATSIAVWNEHISFCVLTTFRTALSVICVWNVNAVVYLVCFQLRKKCNDKGARRRPQEGGGGGHTCP